MASPNTKNVQFIWVTSGKEAAAKTAHASDGAILFVESESAIYVNGSKFGVTAAQIAELSQLRSDVNGLAFFNTVSGDTGNKVGATKPGTDLPIKGDGTIATEVSTDGVKIKLTVAQGTTEGSIKIGKTDYVIKGYRTVADTDEAIAQAKAEAIADASTYTDA